MTRIYKSPRAIRHIEDRARDYRRQLAHLRERGEDLADYDVLLGADGTPVYAAPKHKEKTCPTT